MFLKQLVLILAISLFASANCIFAGCSDVFFKTTAIQQLGIPLRGTPVFFNVASEAVVYRDIDADGFKDLLGYSDIINGVSGRYLVFYKGSAAGFNMPPAVSSFGTDLPVLKHDAFADFNNDGKLDVIGQGVLTPQTATIYLNDGNGNFTASTSTAIGLPNGNGEFVVAAADLNSDNRPDIITSGSSDGAYYRLLSPAGTFGAVTSINAIARILQVADLNNDGKTDVLISVFSSSIQTLVNQGNASFTGGNTVAADAFGIPQVVGDLNNDGRLDAVSPVYPDQQGQYIFTIFLTDASGGISKTNVNVSGVTSFWGHRARVSDFDGDGLKDILFFSGAEMIFAKNNGSLNFTLKKITPSPNFNPFVDEFNSDGKTDLFTLNNSFLNPENIESVSFKQNVCTRSGQTKFVDFDHDGQTQFGYWRASDGLWQYVSAGSNIDFYWGLGSLGDIPVPQDYDGDGITDYAVFRNSNGAWYILRSSDGQVAITLFGSPGDKPVPSDFDGDGKADIAVYRPSNGNWYAWQSGSNNLFAATFGLNGDIPLPMDYDGDRKADLAVFRPSNGTWYFFKTANQSYYVYNFGLNGDYPVPADYDNDGRADMTIFRDGRWYLYKLNGATFTGREFYNVLVIKP